MTSPAPTTVAFIGLGNMGGPMAANLVKAGVTVRGVDPSEEARERAAAAGVEVVDDIAAAVPGADAVITMLPSGAHVLDAYRQIIDVAASGTLLADCSTIAVEDAVEASRRAGAAGFQAVDAPVSGGVVGATAGTLTFMLGSSDAVRERAVALLEPMAGRVVPCGDNGAGQAAKVCNNLMLAVSMLGVSEAFVLGERLGLDPQALYDVASTSSGACWALTVNCPVPGPVPTSPANREFQPGFATALMSKDLGLAMDAISSTGTASILGTVTAGVYRDLAENGGAGRDFSSVIEEIRISSERTPA